MVQDSAEQVHSRVVRQNKLLQRHAGRLRGTKWAERKVPMKSVPEPLRDESEAENNRVRIVSNGRVPRVVSQAKAEKAKKLSQRYAKQEASSKRSDEPVVDEYETRVKHVDTSIPPTVSIPVEIPAEVRNDVDVQQTLSLDGAVPGESDLVEHKPLELPSEKALLGLSYTPATTFEEDTASTSAAPISSIKTLSLGKHSDRTYAKSDPGVHRPHSSAVFEKRLALFEQFSRNGGRENSAQSAFSTSGRPKAAFEITACIAEEQSQTEHEDIGSSSQSLALGNEKCSSPKHGDEESSSGLETFTMEESVLPPDPAKSIPETYSTDASEGERPVSFIPDSAVRSIKHDGRIVTPELTTATRRSPDAYCGTDQAGNERGSFLDDNLFLYEGSRTPLNQTLPDFSGGDAQSLEIGTRADSAFASVASPRMGVPFGGLHNESLEYSMISLVDNSDTEMLPFDASEDTSADTSPKDTNHSFDTDTTGETTSPSPKHVESFDSTCTGSTEDESHSVGRNEEVEEQEEVMVVSSRSIEVCLQGKEGGLIIEDEDGVNDLLKHNLLKDLVATAREDLPFIARQIRKEVKEIRKDFRSISYDMSDTAEEIRRGPSTFLGCCGG